MSTLEVLQSCPIMKSLIICHWENQSLRIKHSIFWCRPKWAASFPLSCISNLGWCLGEEHLSYNYWWGDFYLHHVYILLESHWFSTTHYLTNYFEIIWWSYFLFSWDSHHISHRAWGKTISIEVEVVDAPIEYNLLLERTWFYEIKVVIFYLFYVMCFHHLWKFVTIDSLDYCTLDLRTNANTNVSFYSDSPRGYVSVNVGLFKDSYLLGTFPPPLLNIGPMEPIYMISCIGHFSLTSYDHWITPHNLEVDSFGATMSLSPAEMSYSTI